MGLVRFVTTRLRITGAPRYLGRKALRRRPDLTRRNDRATVGGRTCVVHAARGDRHGNLVFNKAARNFNPLAAMAGRICIAQVEQLVEPGELDPDSIHLPGVFVHRIVEVGTDIPKRIERRTVAAEGA